MLTYKQIKSLAKPYTDRQITNLSGKVMGGQEHGWWSNGQIAFYEPGPRKVGASAIPWAPEGSDRTKEQLDEKVSRCTVLVWPVELRPYDDSGLTVVRMTDSNGVNLWYNARYIAAMLKRDKTASFYADPDSGAVISRNGHTIAVVAPYEEPDDEQTPAWSLCNEQSPTALRFARALDAAIPKGKRGQQWHETRGILARRVKVRRARYIEVGDPRTERVVARISLFNGDVSKGATQT